MGYQPVRKNKKLIETTLGKVETILSLLNSDTQGHYRNWIHQGPMAKLINTKWFSMYSINGSVIPMPRELNFFYLQNQIQQFLLQFN